MPGDVLAAYTYLGAGTGEQQVVEMRSATVTNGELDQFTHFFLSGQQVIETRQGEDQSGQPPAAEGLGPYEQFVWSARYIDSLVLRDRNEDGDSGTGDLGGDGNPANGVTGLDERLFYLSDANYNVTALVDTSGDVVERYLYDAYGKVTVLGGDPTVDPDGQGDPSTYPEWSVDPDGKSDVANTTLFTGRELDLETGVYYYRQRIYHPTLSTWLTRDGIGYAAGDQNLYRYVSNRATGAIDPYGLEFLSGLAPDDTGVPFAGLPSVPSAAASPNWGPPLYIPPAAPSGLGMPLFGVGGLPTLTDMVEHDPFIDDSWIPHRSWDLWEEFFAGPKPLQWREEPLVLPAPLPPEKVLGIGLLWWRMDGTLVQEGVVFEWNDGDPVPIGYLDEGWLVRAEITLIPGEPDYVAGLGFLCEPIDWYVTVKDILKDPTDPLNYAGFLPFVTNAAAKAGRKLDDAFEQFRNLRKGLDDVPLSRADELAEGAEGLSRGAQRGTLADDLAAPGNVSPRSPAGRPGFELRNSPHQPVRNVPTMINGRGYTGHALDQMQNRGLVPSVIEDTIGRGVATPGRGGATIYTTEQARVIVNQAGEVISVYPQ